MECYKTRNLTISKRSLRHAQDDRKWHELVGYENINGSLMGKRGTQRSVIHYGYIMPNFKENLFLFVLVATNHSGKTIINFIWRLLFLSLIIYVFKENFNLKILIK